MQRAIKITFPLKKKNKDDAYKVMANFFESDAGSCFILGETNRELQRQRHTVTEGSLTDNTASLYSSSGSFSCTNNGACVNMAESFHNCIMINQCSDGYDATGSNSCICVDNGSRKHNAPVSYRCRW